MSTPHKVHFEDGHAVIVSAKNTDLALTEAQHHRHGVKVVGATTVKPRTHKVHVRELPSADAIHTLDALFPRRKDRTPELRALVQKMKGRDAR